jgi:hypothetical protein
LFFLNRLQPLPYEALSSPDNDRGLFKYVGLNPKAQFYLSKISQKRDVQRAGLGFVILRAELSDHFRLSFDIEISQEVIGKNPNEIIDAMYRYVQDDYSSDASSFVIYVQPAHSGQRGWDDKTFVGVEINVSPDDFNRIPRLKKRLIDSALKLFQAIDFALTE